jgi:hypothetical protein
VQVIGHHNDEMQMPSPDAVVVDSRLYDAFGLLNQDLSPAFARTDS